VRDESRIEQLANAFPGYRGVVADDRKSRLLLPDDFVEQAFRCSDTHESANHDACPGRYHRDGFFDANSPHDLNSSEPAVTERTEVTVMLRRTTSVPLICIKASRYSVRELVTPTPSIALPSMQEAVKIQSEFFQDQCDRRPTIVKAWAILL
jgi:hypothetical protein